MLFLLSVCLFICLFVSLYLSTDMLWTLCLKWNEYLYILLSVCMICLNVVVRGRRLNLCSPVTRRITGRCLEERTFCFAEFSYETRAGLNWETDMIANRSIPSESSISYLKYNCTRIFYSCLRLCPSVCKQKHMAGWTFVKLHYGSS